MRAVGAEPGGGASVRLATPATRDAATVILVSDRPDLHVLVMERTSRAVFSPGATVFPGGAVDPEDAAGAVAARLVGLDDPAASAEQGLPVGGLAFRAAAIRECFEEAGILLAHDASSGQPVDHDDALAHSRTALNAGALAFGDFLAQNDLLCDARALRVFSHWLTPLGAPRRYNTWFFVAPAPDGEEGTHDDNELVASDWVRPADALAQYAAGAIDLIFPTEMSLRVLSRYVTAREVLADLDGVARDAGGRPAVIGEGNGERVALPHDAGRPTISWTIPLPDISFRRERDEARKANS
jgi:8-oxo-dGTP pyrophosphatase MutT (NUDIX family)